MEVVQATVLLICFTNQSPWYFASTNPISPVPNIFAEPDSHIHAQGRRKIAAAYSMTNLVQLEPFIDECSKILEERLEEFAKAGAPMEVSHWMQCYAFDVIGKMTVRFCNAMFVATMTDGVLAGQTFWLPRSRRGYPEHHGVSFQISRLLCSCRSTS